MDKELTNLLDNYENVIYGKAFLINPSIHQLHLLLDYIANLEQQCKKQKEVINKVNKYLNEYDVFKVFSFPLMKRWEEEQVKSSIDYEFKTSLIKDLKEILEDKEVS